MRNSSKLAKAQRRKQKQKASKAQLKTANKKEIKITRVTFQKMSLDASGLILRTLHGTVLKREVLDTEELLTIQLDTKDTVGKRVRALLGDEEEQGVITAPASSLLNLHFD